jgi:hypothetical protein
MEHIAVDHIFPEWDIWVQFCDTVYSLALSLDRFATISRTFIITDNHSKLSWLASS